MQNDEIKNVKPLLQQHNVVRSALITPDSYFGLEEWYMKVFECPKCKTKNPISGTNFCRGCGVTVKMSKTVADYDKTYWQHYAQRYDYCSSGGLKTQIFHLKTKVYEYHK